MVGRRDRTGGRVTKFPSRATLSSREGKVLVEQAFQVWAEHAAITFIHKMSGDVDIEMRWEAGCHGDGSCFNGRGGTLAHAFFPGSKRTGLSQAASRVAGSDYEILRHLGSGHFGDVFLAKSASGENFAIKKVVNTEKTRRGRPR